MDGDLENGRDLNDGSTQLLEVEKRPNVLPLDNSKKAKPGDQDDGATEKLVLDEKLNSNKDASEVKFLSADSQNGDAKIDIENIKLAFTGMTKDELMKYANDPFWIRLRWILFALFWILWIAMLAGAIAIIVMAPKCAPPAPLKWWEQGPLYEIYVRSYKDGGENQDGIGDLKGLSTEIQYIDDLGTSGVILSSVFKSDGSDNDGPESFIDIDPVYGSIEDFKELTAAFKNRSINVILSFIPNHTSNKHPWFLASENGSDVYHDYYVWAPSKGKDESGAEIPPNNWVSVNGGSAWEWNVKRQMFYLHQFGSNQPDLNLRNNKVVLEIKKVLEHWIKLGVKGFQMEKVEFLLEDEELRNESRSTTPSDASHLDWGFYNHLHTTNLPAVADILAQWKNVITNHTEGDGVLLVKGNTTKSNLFDYTRNNRTTIIDLIQSTENLASLGTGFTVEDLQRVVDKVLEKTAYYGARPVWQLSVGNTERIATRVSQDLVDGLTMLSMLLPGTPVTLYGDELGVEGVATSAMPWSNSSHGGFSSAESIDVPESSNYEVANVRAQHTGGRLDLYKDLVKQRESPSIMYGSCQTSVINGTVFVLARIKSGNPGVLAVFNPSDEDVEVNLMSVKNLSEELTVQLKSSNYKQDTVRLKSSEVLLPARTSLVLSFVPQLTS